MRNLLGILAAFCCISGCVPLGSPPVRASLSGGFAAGSPMPRPSSGSSSLEQQPSFVGHGIAHVELVPQSWFSTELQRTFEVGLGYRLSCAVFESCGNTMRHGPALSLGLVLHLDGGREQLTRTILKLDTALLLETIRPQTEVGASVQLGIQYEWLHLVSGSTSDAMALALAAGEFGIGIGPYVGLESVGGQTSFVAGLRTSIQLPALLGFFSLLPNSNNRRTSQPVRRDMETGEPTTEPPRVYEIDDYYQERNERQQQEWREENRSVPPTSNGAGT